MLLFFDSFGDISVRMAPVRARHPIAHEHTQYSSCAVDVVVVVVVACDRVVSNDSSSCTSIVTAFKMLNAHCTGIHDRSLSYMSPTEKFYLFSIFVLFLSVFICLYSIPLSLSLSVLSFSLRLFLPFALFDSLFFFFAFHLWILS